MRVRALAMVAVLTGCAAVAVDPEPGREAVAKIVNDRSGSMVRSIVHPANGHARSERVQTLFGDGLTAEEAVEIALLQNRNLGALYVDLDVAQADLVQASLLHNPVLDAAVGFPVGGGIVDLSFGMAMDVIDLLYVPLRKRVAAASFEATKLRVAGAVLDLAWRAQTTFYEHQASAQMLEIRRQIAAAAGASAELAHRMREAGNTTELDAASERALAEEAQLDLRLAEISVRETRERLNGLMGLWGAAAEGWSVASTRLPDPPDETLDVDRLESRAIERSLDLAAAEQIVIAAGEAVGLDRASALFPEVVVGGEGERDGTSWLAGPTLTLAIPIFDWGQARIARARAELERARELHHALAVELRAATRTARDRTVGHRERALHYRKVLLPVHERVVDETQLQYNAMQVGPLELLHAKERQIEVATRYVEALREYWTARADLGLILAGRMPPDAQAPAQPVLQQLPRFPFPTLQ